MNITSFLDGSDNLQRTACFSDTTELSYQALFSSHRKLARYLRENGFSFADRTLIVSQNRPEILIAMMATAHMGGVFSVLHHASKKDGFVSIFNQVEPLFVFLDSTTAHLAEHCGGAKIIWLDSVGEDFSSAGTGLDLILEEYEEDQLVFDAPADAPVCLVFTSGTTGVPRGVTLSHDNILFVTQAILARLNYKEDDVIGVYLPLSFDYGLYQFFLVMLAKASIFIGRPEFAGPEFLITLSKYRVSVLPGVPTLYSTMIKLLKRKPIPLPELRMITNTGAHLSKEQIQQLKSALSGLEVFPMYGLTECKRVSILLPNEFDAYPNSVGRPLDGTQACIVDENGDTLPFGEPGELMITGRHVSLGYWRCESETALRFPDQGENPNRILLSGDICSMDSDGFLYFHGRKDALIKHHGYRIHPLEIENAVSSLSGVLDAAVVHIAESDTLHLFVLLIEDVQVKEILTNLRDQVEPYKIPDKIHVLPEIPKNRNGKHDHKKLLALVS